MSLLDDRIAAAAAAADALKAANDRLQAEAAARDARIAELEAEVPNPESLATLDRIAALASRALPDPVA